MFERLLRPASAIQRPPESSVPVPAPDLLALQRQAGNAALVDLLAGAPSALVVQRDTPKAIPDNPAKSTEGSGGPAPMSDEIRKLGVEGVPHAANRVRDAIEAVFDNAAGALATFEHTEQYKDVERSSWDLDLVLSIASLAVGGFISKLMAVEFGHGHVREAVTEAWEKGFEAAGDEATKRAFGETLPEKTYPIVAFMDGQRQILASLKKRVKDDFDNKTSPALHLRATKDPATVPGILDELQAMVVAYDRESKTAGGEHFRRTLDAWNVYMAKSALIPASDKRAKTETPLGPIVSAGGGGVDFPPGVLQIRATMDRGFRKIVHLDVGIAGLNESLRSAFKGRRIRDLALPKVATISLTDPIRSLVIGRNEGGGYYLDAPSDVSWMLYELAVPDWRQRAQGVKEGTARAQPMERDVWEGARIVLLERIGEREIEEVRRISD